MLEIKHRTHSSKSHAANMPFFHLYKPAVVAQEQNIWVRIVPGKCPWVLAAQAPQLRGGQLHGGGLCLHRDGHLPRTIRYFQLIVPYVISVQHYSGCQSRSSFLDVNTTPADCLQTPSTLKQPSRPQHSSHLQTLSLIHI